MAGPLGNPSKTKRRFIPPTYLTQRKNGVSFSGPVNFSGGFEKVASDGHNLALLGHGDQGGPLILERSVNTFTTGVELTNTFGTIGSQVCIHPTQGIPGTLASPDRTTLWGLGGTAISRTLPTRPAFAGGTAIAESIGVQAIPRMVGSSLWRARTLEFKHLGDEYLNVQFGWLPFISDITSCMRAVVNSDDYMKSLRKGSDHKTRVGYRFPDSISHDTGNKGFVIYSSDNAPQASFTQAGILGYDRITGTNTWFKGCFYYHLPATDANMSQSAKFRSYAEHVLGLRLTPEVLWNAAPWSWAVDWAVNVGDVCKNIGAIGRDGLILQYGYIMSHKYDIAHWYGWPNATHKINAMSTTFTNEWKVRWPASPYGFGLTYDGLSLKQKSILAAIGITHW
jgi:hypothetical protein